MLLEFWIDDRFIFLLFCILFYSWMNWKNSFCFCSVFVRFNSFCTRSFDSGDSNGNLSFAWHSKLPIWWIINQWWQWLLLFIFNTRFLFALVSMKNLRGIFNFYFSIMCVIDLVCIWCERANYYTKHHSLAH